jgi:2-C-methyl-D-erythritol 4-phosphate cytidylyltransferase
MKITAIIVSAGKSSRMGLTIKKPFIKINDAPLLYYTLNKFEKSEHVLDIILVVSKEDIEFTKNKIIKKYNFKKIKSIISGGEERQDSVYNGLKACDINTEIVLIHDGARPFFNENKINELVNELKTFDGVILATKITDTIKEAKENIITKTVSRDYLYSIQTPQCFRFDIIKNCYENAYKENFYGTDDASILEHFNYKIKIVDGEKTNIKITTKEDLLYAQWLIENNK